MRHYIHLWFFGHARVHCQLQACLLSLLRPQWNKAICLDAQACSILCPTNRSIHVTCSSKDGTTKASRVVLYGTSAHKAFQPWIHRENAGENPWDGGPLIIPIYTLHSGYFWGPNPL